jgi:hypothetical protein
MFYKNKIEHNIFVEFIIFLEDVNLTKCTYHGLSAADTIEMNISERFVNLCTEVWLLPARQGLSAFSFLFHRDLKYANIAEAAPGKLDNNNS